MLLVHSCLLVNYESCFKKMLLTFLSFSLHDLARYFLLPLSLFQAAYASSDLYSLNGLSSSRNPGSAFNGYQVCIQTNASFISALHLLCNLFTILWRGTRWRLFMFSQPVWTCCLVNLILTPNFMLCCSSTGHSVRAPSSCIVGLVPIISSLPFHAVLNDMCNYQPLTPETELVCL